MEGTSVFVFGDADKVKDWVNSGNYTETSVESAALDQNINRTGVRLYQRCMPEGIDAYF